MQPKTNTILSLLLMLLFFCMSDVSHAEEWKQLFGLRGKWKFEIGDNKKYAEQHYNDSKWETIYAPSAWEDQGYPGYDGYGWYRKHFKSSPNWQYKTLSLQLGNIDDVDEVYLNGHLIGKTGQFPPYYRTAYDANRVYVFSSMYLNSNGDNVIAVRVYDQELGGGMLRGNLGVYEDIEALRVDITLPAVWKFATGDDPEWRSPELKEAAWDSLLVPSFWENQGYTDYDGFAWYRVHFTVPNDFKNEKLILVLGKIDDFDVTYLNSQQIGKTGSMANREQNIPGSNEYGQLRAYYIPKELIHFGGENVLAVRVYDGFKDGGIYSGPIGLVEQNTFLKWQKQEKKKKPYIFDWLFD